MKNIKTIDSLIFLLLTAMLISGCAKDTVDAERFGDIEGIVLNSETDEGIASVNITTAPASHSILTESDGSFTIQNVPIGSYTIQARKHNFSNHSVSVAVREGQTAIARIPLAREFAPTEEDIEAQVTSWFNNADQDSTYVDVNYRISNVSTDVDISEYEVYFEIKTNEGVSFYFDISGDNLQKGQAESGEFRKNIQNQTASDVTVTDIWLPENDE